MKYLRTYLTRSVHRLEPSLFLKSYGGIYPTVSTVLIKAQSVQLDLFPMELS